MEFIFLALHANARWKCNWFEKHRVIGCAVMFSVLFSQPTNTHVKCHIQLRQRKRKQQNLPFKLEMCLKSALFCGFHNFNKWLPLIENRSDLHSFLFNGFEISHRFIRSIFLLSFCLSYQMTVCFIKLLHAFGPKLF